MGMHTLPLVPETQNLYDWAEHEQSYNALKPGTKTTEFTKEAWNWIALTLQLALLNADLEWDDKYTTYSGTMIRAEDPRLTARKFNSIAWNVDRLFPIVWGWASDPNHRGYVGRLEFHGRSQYGNDCDKVYPEYILELVEKVNFIIELMRGTWPTAQGGATVSQPVTIMAAGASNKALVSPTNHKADLKIQSAGVMGKIVALNTTFRTYSKGHATATRGTGMLCHARSRSYSAAHGSGDVFPGALADTARTVYSQEQIRVTANMARLAETEFCTTTRSQGEIAKAHGAQAQARQKMDSKGYALVQKILDGTVTGNYRAVSRWKAGTQVNRASALAAYHLSSAKRVAEAKVQPSRRAERAFSISSDQAATLSKQREGLVAASRKGITRADAKVGKHENASVKANQRAGTKSRAEAQKQPQVNVANAHRAVSGNQVNAGTFLKKQMGAGRKSVTARWAEPGTHLLSEISRGYGAKSAEAAEAKTRRAADIQSGENSVSGEYAAAEVDAVLETLGNITDRTVRSARPESLPPAEIAEGHPSAIWYYPGVESLPPMEMDIQKVCDTLARIEAALHLILETQASGKSETRHSVGILNGPCGLGIASYRTESRSKAETGKAQGGIADKEMPIFTACEPGAEIAQGGIADREIPVLTLIEAPVLGGIKADAINRQKLSSRVYCGIELEYQGGGGDGFVELNRVYSAVQTGNVVEIDMENVSVYWPAPEVKDGIMDLVRVYSAEQEANELKVM